MTSSVISFAYFTQFSNLNISRTYADICKRSTAFLFFHGILCDTPKKSRGKNLIIVPLEVLEECNSIWPDLTRIRYTEILRILCELYLFAFSRKFLLQCQFLVGSLSSFDSSDAIVRFPWFQFLLNRKGFLKQLFMRARILKLQECLRESVFKLTF